MIWAASIVCGEHWPNDCDCAPAIKHRLWELYDDDRRVIGRVEQFHGAYYGTWSGGRTGPVSTLDGAKDLIVERLSRTRLREDHYA